MQIPSLTNLVLSAVGLARPATVTDAPRPPAAGTPEAALPVAPAAPGATTTLRSLAAQYDVHEITPRQFGTLLQELQANAAIPAAELADLAQLRLALDAAGFDPDEPLDLVRFVEDRLRESDSGLLDMTQHAGQSPLQRQLAWLTKLDLLRHTEPLRASA